MARAASKKRQQQSRGVTTQVPAAFDPAGETKPVDIESSKDGWSEYTLVDGTVLRVKAAVLDVKRALDQYDPSGNPIYLVQATFVTQLRVPDNLKRNK